MAQTSTSIQPPLYWGRNRGQGENAEHRHLIMEGKQQNRVQRLQAEKWMEKSREEGRDLCFE